jgi:hypothetical protein
LQRKEKKICELSSIVFIAGSQFASDNSSVSVTEQVHVTWFTNNSSMYVQLQMGMVHHAQLVSFPELFSTQRAQQQPLGNI